MIRMMAGCIIIHHISVVVWTKIRHHVGAGGYIGFPSNDEVS